MNWRILAIGGMVFGLIVGFCLGWSTHARTVLSIAHSAAESRVALPAAFEAPRLLAESPKPPLERPVPITDVPVAVPSAPSALSGDIQAIPDPGTSLSLGKSAPLAPALPSGALPTVDLNADEALAKRVILQNGAEIASVADARDELGTIGRSIVAEMAPSAMAPLRKALQNALGARAIISDAGSGATNDPNISKLEDEIAVARKRRDKDRIDFLPQSPLLQDEEAAVLNLERVLIIRKKALDRVRLNILIRPTL